MQALRSLSERIRAAKRSKSKEIRLTIEEADEVLCDLVSVMSYFEGMKIKKDVVEKVVISGGDFSTPR